MTTESPVRGTVLISYSHKDEVWKDLLIAYLAPLRQTGLLEVWDDRRLQEGENGQAEIKKAIEQASVVVILLSEDYLDSDFIQEAKIQRLVRSGKAYCFLVMVRPCVQDTFRRLRQGSHQLWTSGGEALSRLRGNSLQTNLQELAREVFRLAGFNPQAASLPAEPHVSISRIPATTTELFGREAELKNLDDAWENPQIRVVSIVGLGGIGKTALVSHWLSRMARDRFRGAEWIFGWSFSGKTTLQNFLWKALEWFGDPNPTEGSPEMLGERLAEHVLATRTLLILDGIEMFQDKAGRIQREELETFLRRLASSQRGLALLTSRIFLPERWITAHLALRLGSLAPDAGAALLRSTGVRGSDVELTTTHHELEGHPLSLVLLGNSLRERLGGAIERRDELFGLGKAGLDAEAVRQMLDQYGAILEQPERDLLRLFGLFERPATWAEIASLCEEPIQGLTALELRKETGREKALHSLLEIGLLILDQPNVRNGPVRAHAFVREHFRNRLRQERPEAFRQGHERLFLHLAAKVSGAPDTLEEMKPLIDAVEHGCAANLRQEAFKFYRERIARGDSFYLSRTLGAPETDLRILSSFFKVPWDQPQSDLDPQADALRVLKASGYALLTAARLREARMPFTVLLQRARESKDWADAVWAARRLSEAQLYLGDLGQASVTGREAVELAEKDSDQDRRAIALITLADALHQAGRLQEAEQAVEGTALASYRYFNLQLTLGRYQPMLKPISDLQSRAERSGQFPRAALAHLALGRAQMELGEAASAGSHFNRAVEILRSGVAQHWFPAALIARAHFQLRLGVHLDEARRDLTEALDHATRYELRLHEADAHLDFSRLHLITGDTERARQSLSRARTIVDETGYHRRDAELQELEQRLSSVAAVSSLDPVALAFRLVLAGHALPDLLLHPDLQKIEEAARRLSDEPGDPLLNAQRLLEQQQPGVVPNPLWASWIAVTQGGALHQAGRKNLA